MKKTQQILFYFCWTSIAVSLLIALLFETNILESGAWMQLPVRLFYFAVVMELLLLFLAPLALYMFRISAIRRSLTKDLATAPQQLLLWGTIRMSMLCLPMVANTLFYYLFGLQPAFGYMAIILLLCLLLIYPSIERCEREVKK